MGSQPESGMIPLTLKPNNGSSCHWGNELQETREEPQGDQPGTDQGGGDGP